MHHVYSNLMTSKLFRHQLQTFFVDKCIRRMIAAIHRFLANNGDRNTTTMIMTSTRARMGLPHQ
jgi:hypothetical protein